MWTFQHHYPQVLQHIGWIQLQGVGYRGYIDFGEKP